MLLCVKRMPALNRKQVKQQMTTCTSCCVCRFEEHLLPHMLYIFKLHLIRSSIDTFPVSLAPFFCVFSLRATDRCSVMFLNDTNTTERKILFHLKSSCLVLKKKNKKSSLSILFSLSGSGFIIPLIIVIREKRADYAQM